MFVPFGCTCFPSPLDILIYFLIVIPAKVLPPDVLSLEKFIPHVASWTSRVLRFLTHLRLDIHGQRTHGH